MYILTFPSQVRIAWLEIKCSTKNLTFDFFYFATTKEIVREQQNRVLVLDDFFENKMSTNFVCV